VPEKDVVAFANKILEAEKLLENAADRAVAQDKSRMEAGGGGFDKASDTLKEKLKDIVPNQVHSFVHPAFIKDKDKVSKTPIPTAGKPSESVITPKEANKGAAMPTTPMPPLTPKTRPTASPPVK
jgi:hypothetical protein